MCVPSVSVVSHLIVVTFLLFSFICVWFLYIVWYMCSP